MDGRQSASQGHPAPRVLRCGSRLTVHRAGRRCLDGAAVHAEEPTENSGELFRIRLPILASYISPEPARLLANKLAKMPMRNSGDDGTVWVWVEVREAPQARPGETENRGVCSGRQMARNLVPKLVPFWCRTADGGLRMVKGA